MKHLTAKWRAVVAIHLAAALLWLSGELLLGLFAPERMRVWNLAWFMWLAGFTAAAWLPTLFEPVLFLAGTPLEKLLAILSVALGVTSGAAVVYLVGDTARATFDRRRSRWPAFDRFLCWTERLHAPWTYLLLGLLLAVPGLVDSLALYLAALLGLKLSWFLLTVLLATVIRGGLVVAFGEAVL